MKGNFEILRQQLHKHDEQIYSTSTAQSSTNRPHKQQREPKAAVCRMNLPAEAHSQRAALMALRAMNNATRCLLARTSTVQPATDARYPTPRARLNSQ